jgi:threonylcarbamoyladenosine tRNA methylthiotransferase MtaB
MGDKQAVYRGSVAIHTHGCKLNQADSNVLARQFIESGYKLVDSVAEADVYVLNTCTVTATADRKALQALRSVRRANPDALIVATGCFAQRKPVELARLGSASIVVGNFQKDNLVSQVMAVHQKEQDSVALVTANLVATSQGIGRTRAMVKIQEGCNQVCSYCIVPSVRGRERSISPDTLLRQINHLVAEGFKEVVLTGTQLGTYGFDIPGVNLVRLVQRILDETEVCRLRMSSLQAQEITQELLELWQNPRLCPHFHVPLQSGSNKVLKAMRRRYSTDQFATTLDKIRKKLPYAGITTDLIVGFPVEGECEFRESWDFARAMGFSDMHIFPYSVRPGTSSAYLNGHVPDLVKKKRTAEMLLVAKDGLRVFREGQLGSIRSVLWESARENAGSLVNCGLTDNYIRVYANGGVDLRNEITLVRLKAIDDEWVCAPSI